MIIMNYHELSRFIMIHDLAYSNYIINIGVLKTGN